MQAPLLLELGEQVQAPLLLELGEQVRAPLLSELGEQAPGFEQQESRQGLVPGKRERRRHESEGVDAFDHALAPVFGNSLVERRSLG